MNFNNLAQKTNFIAGSDKLDLTNLYLHSLNIPGFSFSSPELSGRSGTKLNVCSDSVNFSNLSFEVLIDEDFLIYHEFTDKLFTHINPTSGSFANIEFDFFIQINNNKGNNLFKIEFNSCRIESVGDISLESGSDETEMTMSVDIKFDYFNVIRSDKTIYPVLQV